MSANLMKEKEVETPIGEDTLFEKENIVPSKKIFNFNLLEFLLIVPLIGMLYTFVVMIDYFQHRGDFISEILNVKTSIQRKYNDGNYKLLDSTVFNKDKILMNTFITVSPASIINPNDAFAIEIGLYIHPQLTACEIFAEVGKNFEVVKINNKIVDKNIVKNYEDCDNIFKKQQKTITLISK